MLGMAFHALQDEFNEGEDTLYGNVIEIIVSWNDETEDTGHVDMGAQIVRKGKPVTLEFNYLT